MIVKILKKSKIFNAVRYNTDKIDRNKGELMCAKNFDALKGIGSIRPSDYINYLQAISAKSSKIKYPQFHAVISAKGRTYNKQQLEVLAEKWLEGMGYGKQPYLLVFHNDTNNNHIHLVSTRVDRNGRKISDSFERIRSYKILNQILGINEETGRNLNVEKALKYNFSTRAQFMMILESQGFKVIPSVQEYKICKFGKELTTVQFSVIDSLIKGHVKKVDRIKQLRAIIEKYRKKYDPSLSFIHNEYSSSLAEFLKLEFGLQILFHSKNHQKPYGYTLIDNATQNVFKGGEILDLNEFIKSSVGEFSIKEKDIKEKLNVAVKFDGQEERIHASEFENTLSSEIFVIDSISPLIADINIDIADDIDDEAILGRNRQRKRKARTNTR